MTARSEMVDAFAMGEIVEKKAIRVTAKPLTVIGEVAVGARPADDPEFKAAARLLLTKFQNAPSLIDALLEAAA